MFIVIDSIDGGGSETQGNLVTQKLKAKGQNVTLLKFPNYDNPIGKMIKEFLYENKNLDVTQQFLLYSLQFIFSADQIKKESEQGIVIADRYFTTTLVFQTLQGFSENTALQYARDFGIIQPDVSFFLNVTPETAFKWKHGEDKTLNTWEKDLSFIKKTYDKYTDLVKRDVFGNWVDINGERSKDEVADDIVARIIERTKHE